ncbi:hypothetical protein GCM10009098_29120 [Rheinheimera aquimaris]|uniref:TolA protein n=1 Tax=Rheinheimera aquimaris TaxID=412437 RepID=A0ABP3P339_9GAMM|nr:MAP7 domain-containing protein [Rheinheimera aquimaris]MCB5214486.1 ATP synthase F0 subunit B [Rheinheimera aquimaris]
MSARLLFTIRNVLCLLLLGCSAGANAGRYQPAPEWLQSVSAPEPFLPYRLGVVEFKEGTSGDWLEYMGDLRAALRGSNYFQSASAPRLRLEIERGIQSGSVNEDGCKTSPGSLSLTYRFLDAGREITSFAITTRAPMNGDSNDFDAAMAGNLKHFLLQLRRTQADAGFAATADALAATIQQELGEGSSLGCNVGMVLANGFVAAMEGTIAVIEGVGEVAGAVVEVAASPEFQNTLNAEMANYQAQQAQQDAYYRNLQAQANAQAQAQAEAKRQRQLAVQQQKAAEQQAGREALAKQLAEGIAYRNQQIAKTTDATTLAKLRRDNEGALQAAQQIGMYSQVDSMATQATQAGFDQARVQRTADEQAEKQRLAAQRAEQERQQRELEARQRAEQQRLAAEKAAQERAQRELEARQRVEQQRLAAQRAEQEKKQAWSDYLAVYRRSIRLGAKQCDGKDKPYRLIGDRPSNPLPKVISHYSSCISVHYEARCPGTPKGVGVKATQYNFTGMGLGCLSAESLMPQRLACKDEDVIVETIDVTGCS